MASIHELVPGDRVVTYKAFVLRHPVIYAGNGQFFEKAKSGQVWLRPASTFPTQDFVVEYRPAPAEARSILRRAFTRLGQEGYDPIRANCQHFVNEVYTGQSQSEQVEGLKAFAFLAGVFCVLAAVSG